MFTLSRPDVLPVDDFGVREGWRRLKGLAAQPKPRALAEIGEAWAPNRSTAAWYLWRAAEEGKCGGSALTGKADGRAKGPQSRGDPMKVCVFGAGAIGGYLAVELALAGHEVSVVARGSICEPFAITA